MVDLKSQYLGLKDEIDAAIGSVIDSTAFIRGQEVKLFEDELAEYLGAGNIIGCGNGTDALQVALMSLDLKPGDEVITSDFTFIATIEVIALLGLKPVLIDPDPNSFNITAEKIQEAVTERTKVILPVHLFGQCAEMEAIMKIASERNIYVIEDTAQAIGSDYIFSDGKRKKAGTIGTLGTTSFFPSKNLGCFGDGGAIICNDQKLATKIRSIVNHGMSKKYYHDFVGVNSRLDTIQAAILRVKLKHLDRFNDARRKAADTYNKAFNFTKGITTPKQSSFSSHIFHQYTLRLDAEDRDSLKEYLNLKSIPSMVYYPVPLHKQKAYSYLGLDDSDYIITGQLCKSVLSLPMHTEFSEEQINYICSNVMEYFEEI